MSDNVYTSQRPASSGGPVASRWAFPARLPGWLRAALVTVALAPAAIGMSLAAPRGRPC